MESVERISIDVEEEQNRTAKVCALPGAQMRGAWATQIQWLGHPDSVVVITSPGTWATRL